MQLCKNPECKKELPEGKIYCNEDCIKKALDLKKQSRNSFSDELRDGAFQKGIMWRKNKLLTIYEARKSKVSDEEIMRELRIGGITKQKARELMKDSEERLGR